MKDWKLYGALSLVVALLVAKGGVAAMGGLIRFLLPAVIIYVGYRFVRNMMLPEGEKREPVAGRDQKANVIEICPDCGAEKKSGHRC